MNKQKNSKVKVWYEEHKSAIEAYLVVAGVAAAGFCFGMSCGIDVTQQRYGVGIARLAEDGFIKLCDPSTGTEVGLFKCVDLVKQHYKR